MKTKETCKWTETDRIYGCGGEPYYKTSCDNFYTNFEIKAICKEIKFCPYCGKPIEAINE